MNEQRFFKRVLTRVGELELPPGDVLIARSLELYGEWAQAELDVICVCLNRGDTVIDIGACFGTHALSFAEAVGPTGRVFAIEGSSANFEYLTRNCRRNAGANVRALLAVVVADGKSAYEETHDDENWGGTRFAPASPGSVSPPLAAVSVDSLDVGQVDFMKIDVEGMESEVLAGAHATIQAHRPIIFFEVNSVEQGLKACEALRKYSYDLYGVVTPAYKSGNFRKELHNIFGDAAECGVLAVANDRENSTRDILRRLPRIKTADDLALLLLHKPQYAGHDIGLNVAAKVLGLPPSPSRLKACLAESNAQVADRDARLKSSIAEAETLRAERAAVADENAQLRELVGKAKILATRAGEFPFNFYFRRREKYLALIKSLRSANLPSAAPDVCDAARPKSEHPGGYKALHLKEIEPLLAPRSVAELDPDYHQDEALLALAELQGLLDQFDRDKTLYVAFSQDDYQTISGGLQLSVGIEAQVAIDRGDIYLHAHPTTILRTLAPADMDDRPYLRLTLNNRPLGLAGYKLVAEAIQTQVKRKSRIIVHQLLGHAPERITEIIRGTSERPIFWLHDYFSICTSSQLMRNEITFCGAPSVQSNACRICTHGPTRAGHRARIDAMWETNQFLFLAPSRVAAEIFLTKAGLSEHDIKIVPHTAVRFTPTSSGGVAQWPHIRIAFAGNPGIHKAWPLFEQIAKRYADDPRFKFFYFGTRRVSEFVTFVQVHVKAQTRNAMVDAIRENDIDIVVHLPPWPETFSFTTQEALAAGAYVVTQKVSGNTAALVADSKRGIILEDAAAYEDLFADGTIVELGREARRRRADETAAVIFSKQCFEIVQDQNAL